MIKTMWPHNKKIWPFVNAYEVEARFMLNDVEGAFELIDRCWGNMIRQGATTFWEMSDIQDGTFTAKSLSLNNDIDCVNSACHGWSGWISYILTKYVLGVQILESGYKKFTISPMLGKLKKVEGKVSTAYGEIKISIHGKHITVSCPEQTNFVCTNKNFCYNVISNKEVNNEKVS